MGVSAVATPLTKSTAFSLARRSRILAISRLRESQSVQAGARTPDTGSSPKPTTHIAAFSAVCRPLRISESIAYTPLPQARTILQTAAVRGRSGRAAPHSP